MAQKRILITDDEENLRKGYAMALGRENYNITLAESGEKAIELLKSNQFDMVITDLQMYGVDGVKLLEYVKQNQPNCSMIMITGYGSTDSALKALKQGTYDYLTKPLDLAKLVLLVKKCFEEKEHPKQKVNELQDTAEQGKKKVTIIERLLKSFRYSEDVFEVDINEIILHIVKMFEEGAKVVNIKLETDLQAGIPVIMADPLAIEQVFMHLITNAYDALNGLNKENKKIEIKSFINETNEIVVSIKDNGCGISEDKYKFLFKPGFTTKTLKKGEKGFGLSFSKKAVERLKGNIIYETQEGIGSTFTIKLPKEEKKQEKILEINKPQEEKKIPIKEKIQVPVQKSLEAEKIPEVKKPQVVNKPPLKEKKVNITQPEIVTTKPMVPLKIQGVIETGGEALSCFSTKKRIGNKVVGIVIGGILVLSGFSILAFRILSGKKPEKIENTNVIAEEHIETIEKLCLENAIAGKFKLAIAEYEKILDNKSSPAEKIFKTGLNYKKEKLLNEAMMEFIKTIALQPDHLEAYIQLANIYKEKGMYDTGIIVCKQSLMIKKEYSLAQYTIASLYALKNLKKDSAKWLLWAVKQDSNYINMMRENKDFDNIRNSDEFKKQIK